MPADRALTPLRPHRRAPDDGGFTLVEVIVALAVISVVMAGTAPFLVQSLSVVNEERTEQVATEMANNALERIRALNPSSLLAGRGLLAAENQLAAAPAAARDAFADTQIAGDPLLDDYSVLGAEAPLPTEPLTVTGGGAEYHQSWYVGRCWQLKADPTVASAAISDCVATDPTKPGVAAVPFFRVVVAVTWQHTSCAPPGECVYVASLLVSSGSDPVFDLKRPPPTISPPVNQEGYVLGAVSLKLFASGGTLPRKWSQTGLPLDLTLAPGTGLITGQLKTAGTYPITIEVEDRDGRTDDATFTWVVAQLPVLTTPTAQISRTGTATSVAVVVTGGLQPMTWSATNLPGGLTIDPATGVISGVPTTVETQLVTVTVIDHGEQTRTTPPFSWRVLTPVSLDPGSLSATTAPGSYDFTSLAHGGLGPYTGWTATNLPAGMVLDSKTGIATVTTRAAASRYLAILEVTDAAAGKATATLVITVTPSSVNDLRVTAPDPTGPDQNTKAGDPVNLTAVAAGTSGYTWTAPGLPPKVTISTAGVMTGTPTAPGTYVVTLTVTDTAMSVAKLMFTWTVSP